METDMNQQSLDLSERTIQDLATLLLCRSSSPTKAEQTPRLNPSSSLLMGTATVTADEKGRIFIPALHLDILGNEDRFVGVVDAEKQRIYLFTQPVFMELISLQTKAQPLHTVKLEQIRITLQNSVELTRDKANRLNLKTLLNTIGIAHPSQVAVKGSGNYLEIEKPSE